MAASSMITLLTAPRARADEPTLNSPWFSDIAEAAGATGMQTRAFVPLGVWEPVDQNAASSNVPEVCT